MNEQKEKKPPDNMDFRTRSIPTARSLVRRFKSSWEFLTNGLGIHPIGNHLSTRCFLILKDFQE